MERIVVRRGCVLTYELLRRTFGGDPKMEIIWDRRCPIDGTPASGAPVERRGRPPVEWDRLDYLLASGKRPDTRNDPPAS